MGLSTSSEEQPLAVVSSSMSAGTSPARGDIFLGREFRTYLDLWKFGIPLLLDSFEHYAIVSFRSEKH